MYLDNVDYKSWLTSPTVSVGHRFLKMKFCMVALIALVAVASGAFMPFEGYGKWASVSYFQLRQSFCVNTQKTENIWSNCNEVENERYNKIFFLFSKKMDKNFLWVASTLKWRKWF